MGKRQAGGVTGTLQGWGQGQLRGTGVSSFLGLQHPESPCWRNAQGHAGLVALVALSTWAGAPGRAQHPDRGTPNPDMSPGSNRTLGLWRGHRGGPGLQTALAL